MKKLLSAILILPVVLSALTSCNMPANYLQEGDGNKISIVATIFPLYDFARAVTGDEAELTMLIKPGAEAHSYDPSPADIIKIQNADVFLYVGGISDGWVTSILSAVNKDNMQIVRLMDSITALDEEIVEGMDHSEEEHNDKHTEHDVGGYAEYDEHIWTSPDNAAAMVNSILKAVCRADEDNENIYIHNAKEYTAEIAVISKEIQEIADNSQDKLLVFGDRFPFRYLADRFGLTYRAAFPGCSTETDVSAETLAYLIDLVKEKNIPYIYHIELSNQNIAKVICDQTGAQMLMLHSCQSVTAEEFREGVTYLSLMRKNAENLKKGLR